MGLFNSGVGRRSRQAAVDMSKNSDALYMGTEDLLRGGVKDARKTISNAYNSSRDLLRDAYSGSRGSLTTGQQASTDYLNAGMAGALGFNEQARGDLITGRDAALGSLTGPGESALSSTRAGYAEALQALGSRYGQAGDQLQGAVDAFDPLLSRGMEGLDRYSALINGSLGAGTPEERQAAVDAFQAGPGYQWQVQQASQAAQRAANRTGSASSGNAMDAVTRLSSNLANQEYGSWQDRLVEQQSGYRQQAQSATAGRAGALTNLGQLYAQQGGAEAGLLTDRANQEASIFGRAADVNQTSGQNLAANSNAGGEIVQTGNAALATNATNYAQLLSGLQTQYGQDRANLRTSYGSTVAGLQTGLAGARASNLATLYNSYNEHLGIGLQGGNAQGQETASWGQGLLGLGSKVLGMASGGGGGGGLLSLFK